MNISPHDVVRCRYDNLMAIFSFLDSKLSTLHLSPGQGTALCYWARYFTLTVPGILMGTSDQYIGKPDKMLGG